jgi:hypothetical protein
MQKRIIPRYCPVAVGGLPGLRLVECGHQPRKDRPIMTPRGRTVANTSVHLVWSGHGSLTTLGSDHRLEPGMLMVLREGVHHRFDPDPGSWLEEYWFAVAGNQALALCDALAPGVACFRVADPEALRARFEELIAMAAPGLDVPGWRATARALDLLAGILADRADAAAGGLGGIGDAVDRWLAVVQNRACEADSPLQRFLWKEGLAADTFRRRCTARTGHPPHALWQRAKLARAKGLLRGTDLSISAVGEAVGLPSPYWFTQWFRRATGLSPTAWRRGSG